MKFCAVVWCLALPLWCFAQSNPAIQTQREFDLQVVAEGRWHPVWVDWDAAGRMWLATASQQDGPSRRGSILVFDKAGRRFRGSSMPGRSSTHSYFIVTASLRAQVRAQYGCETRWGWRGGNKNRSSPVGRSAICARDSTAGFMPVPASATSDSRDLSDSSRMRRRFKLSPRSRAAGCIRHFLGARTVFLPSRGPHLSHIGLFSDTLAPAGSPTPPSSQSRRSRPRLGTTPRAISTLASIAGSVAPAQPFVAAIPGIPFQRVSGLCIYEGGAWPSASTEIRTCATLSCIWFTKMSSAAPRAPTTRALNERLANSSAVPMRHSSDRGSLRTGRRVVHILGITNLPRCWRCRAARRVARRHAVRACLACAAQTPANAENC